MCNAFAQNGTDGCIYGGRIRRNRLHQRLHLHFSAAYNAWAEIDGAHHVAENVPNASDAVHLSRVPGKSTPQTLEMAHDVGWALDRRPPAQNPTSDSVRFRRAF